MRDIEDEKHNTTRFVVLAGEPDNAKAGDGPIVTTFIFRVRNVPAALYKAMGGFATNGVNMTKLESYQLDGRFVATMFFSDIEGHPTTRRSSVRSRSWSSSAPSSRSSAPTAPAPIAPRPTRPATALERGGVLGGTATQSLSRALCAGLWARPGSVFLWMSLAGSSGPAL